MDRIKSKTERDGATNVMEGKKTDKNCLFFNAEVLCELFKFLIALVLLKMTDSPDALFSADVVCSRVKEG